MITATSESKQYLSIFQHLMARMMLILTEALDEAGLAVSTETQ